MTSAEITRELRAARPTASTALRERVLAEAARGPAPESSFQERLRGLLRRPLVLVPAAAALVLAATLGVAISRPDGSGGASDRLASAGGSASAAGGAELQDAAALPNAKAATTAPAVRAQRIGAWLSLQVPDGEALADATADAIGIVRSLDGYVVRSDVTAGDEGSATLSLRVPSAAAQDAVARLSQLGTIVGQRVQADDLQGSLDAVAAEQVRLRAQLAAVRARLATADLTPAERAAAQARRDVLAARLAQARQQQAILAAQATEATIDVEIRTQRSAGIVAPPSRFDRTLGRALDLLAWEALVALGLLVAVAPFALLATAAVLVRRRVRHRDADRLLGVA